MTSDEKIAIVTGSNKGIGYEVVRGLCKKFHGIVYLTARSEENGKKAVESLEKEGLHPVFRQLDVDSEASVKAFAEFLKQAHPNGIDVLINNAGIMLDETKNMERLDHSKAEQTINTNYFGVLRVCDSVFPMLKSNARVIHVSSRLGLLTHLTNAEIRARLISPTVTIEDISAEMRNFVESVKDGSYKTKGYPKFDPTKGLTSPSYSVSKIGVNSIVEIQQRQLDADKSRTGIVVSSMCPGYCKTDLTDNKGFLTVQQGAQTVIYLATEPKDFTPTRGSFWAENKIKDWKNGTMYTTGMSMLFKSFFPFLY